MTEFPYEDNTDVSLIQPIIDKVACSWTPDMGQGWRITYDTQGISGMTQRWVAPRYDSLPVAVRQLLSWNRRKYMEVGLFKDIHAQTADWYKHGLVVVGAEMSPMPASKTPEYMPGHMQAYASANPYVCGDSVCTAAVFPAVLADKYYIDLTWARDEYVNRFGVLYAKVEIDPTARLESMHGSFMGVVPTLSDGGPDTSTPPRSKLTIGFPLREPQTLIRMSYPWVRLGDFTDDGLLLNSILSAGPIGNFSGYQLGLGRIPFGQYLGCVNNGWFMGYPKGHVLYQAATLEQRISPVTGRIGFAVTHEFLALSTASWNQTRFEGQPTSDLDGQKESDAEEPTWPYGYIVAMKKDGSILFVADKPVHPYVHKNFDNLLYYGTVDSPRNIDTEA